MAAEGAGLAQRAPAGASRIAPWAAETPAPASWENLCYTLGQLLREAAYLLASRRPGDVAKVFIVRARGGTQARDRRGSDPRRSPFDNWRRSASAPLVETSNALP